MASLVLRALRLMFNLEGGGGGGEWMEGETVEVLSVLKLHCFPSKALVFLSLSVIHQQ